MGEQELGSRPQLPQRPQADLALRSLGDMKVGQVSTFISRPKVQFFFCL